MAQPLPNVFTTAPQMSDARGGKVLTADQNTAAEDGQNFIEIFEKAGENVEWGVGELQLIAVENVSDAEEVQTDETEFLDEAADDSPVGKVAPIKAGDALVVPDEAKRIEDVVQSDEPTAEKTNTVPQDPLAKPENVQAQQKVVRGPYVPESTSPTPDDEAPAEKAIKRETSPIFVEGDALPKPLAEKPVVEVAAPSRADQKLAEIQQPPAIEPPKAPPPEQVKGGAASASLQAAVARVDQAASQANERRLGKIDHIVERATKAGQSDHYRVESSGVPAPTSVPVAAPALAQSSLAELVASPVFSAAGDITPEGFTQGLGQAQGSTASPIGLQAPAPVVATSPEAAKAVAQQMAVSVSQTSGGVTELQLTPQELGRVRLVLSPQDAGYVVTVMAERQETQDLMRRNIDILAQEFGQLGYEDVTFSFAQHNQGADDNPDQTFGSGQDAADTSAELQHTTPTQIVVSAGLDLRL